MLGVLVRVVPEMFVVGQFVVSALFTDSAYLVIKFLIACVSAAESARTGAAMAIMAIITAKPIAQAFVMIWR